MSWHPASTAPKTGEHILVSSVGGGHFGTCGGKRQDFAAVVHWWDVVGEEGFYLSSGYPHQEADETPIQFTHWMPLGVAPAGGSAAPEFIAVYVNGAATIAYPTGAGAEAWANDFTEVQDKVEFHPLYLHPASLGAGAPTPEGNNDD